MSKPTREEIVKMLEAAGEGVGAVEVDDGDRSWVEEWASEIKDNEPYVFSREVVKDILFGDEPIYQWLRDKYVITAWFPPIPVTNVLNMANIKFQEKEAYMRERAAYWAECEQKEQSEDGDGET